MRRELRLFQTGEGPRPHDVARTLFDWLADLRAHLGGELQPLCDVVPVPPALPVADRDEPMLPPLDTIRSEPFPEYLGTQQPNGTPDTERSDPFPLYVGEQSQAADAAADAAPDPVFNCGTPDAPPAATVKGAGAVTDPPAPAATSEFLAAAADRSIDGTDAGDNDDTIVAGAGDGRDRCNGDAGSDTVDYSDLDGGVNVFLLFGHGIALGMGYRISAISTGCARSRT